MEPIKIGIIGGSGVYQIEDLKLIQEVEIDTPFGKPSDRIIIGTLSGQRIAFLARHGKGHFISPTEINARANIYAMKTLGVESIISISACGSLNENLAPRHIVIPNQLYDHTKKRVYSFFGESLIAHISFAEPFCNELSSLLATAVAKTGAIVHQGGTYIAIEGPRFSTRAESNVFRSWGMDIIGMTAIPEAILAREAEMCYAMMAHVTDYDCWHETEEVVNVQMLIENLNANAEVSKKALSHLLPMIKDTRNCSCQEALSTAIITSQDKISSETKKKLQPLIRKYFSIV
ncbi:S-methyl-5'-thioadenosine phosphorylase [candidate division KSB1 bacterium]|nr:S-methyl-5'-thioadenosine phosphorylase [candidate division KSB1 bacterium]